MVGRVRVRVGGIGPGDELLEVVEPVLVGVLAGDVRIAVIEIILHEPRVRDRRVQRDVPLERIEDFVILEHVRPGDKQRPLVRAPRTGVGCQGGGLIDGFDVGRADRVVRLLVAVAIGKILRERERLPREPARRGDQREGKCPEDRALVIFLDPVHGSYFFAGGGWAKLRISR